MAERLETAYNTLNRTNLRLEAEVAERTAELATANQQLKQELAERVKAEETRRRLLEQSYHAQKIDSLGTLASGIAHDFNNALLPIIGLTELTAESLPKDSRAAANLAKVLRAARHAQGLVRQILAFARQDPPRRKPVAFQPVIRDALDVLRAGLPTTIQIRENLGDEPNLVFADPSQLYQVVVNLGVNAGEAMENTGGVLTVQLDKTSVEKCGVSPCVGLMPGAYYRLMVSDTGHGMAPETVDRVFEPFFTTKEVGKGSGLGLSVVHGIVRGHNGAVNVESAPGRGTTFTVYLPCLQASTEEAQAPGIKLRAV